MSGPEAKLTRRDFLKKIGVATAAATVGYLLPDAGQSVYGAEPAATQAWGILIDLTRCTGCDSCALACKAANQLPHPDSIPHALDCTAYTYVDRCQVWMADGTTQVQYVKRQCMHCLHPACVSACTVGALRKTPEGPVTYNARKCFGCRYCQYACPFGVPAYEWRNPIGLIHKCQLCAHLLSNGEHPACVCACPTGALRFDRRDALLAQAQAQITSNPGRYVNHVYGEQEVGGTAVLYLSKVPFTALGFPKLGPEPIPEYAESVMKLTPVTALTVASLAASLHLLTRQRQGEPADMAVDAASRGGRR